MTFKTFPYTFLKLKSTKITLKTMKIFLGGFAPQTPQIVSEFLVPIRYF